MYIFLNIVDSEATIESLALLILGIIACLVAIPSWLLNYGAYIHINEDSIKAKYHWFGKIDCKLSDVTFAVAGVNTLIIQLKGGKTHTIMGIANSWSLASIIRKNMSFEATEQTEVMIEKLEDLKSAKKKGLIYVCYGLAIMFINIFITVFLTGERSLHEFSKIDWIVLAIMGVIEIATVIAIFYFSKKTGKYNIPIQKQRYEIQRSIIETQPLLLGFIIAVYTDDDYTCRITLFGYPHNNAVYYTVQELDAKFNLIQTYTSEIFKDQEGLPEEFRSWIDITKTVLH